MGGTSLALAAAIAFGTADFLGGVAARRSSALLTTLAGQFAGLVPVGLLLLLQPATPDRAGLAWGAVAGVCGCVGLVLYFRALSEGGMSAAAPVTAVVAAGLPIFAGLLLGERPAAQAWLGVAAGLVAIGLIAGAGGAGRANAGSRPGRPLLLALAAGAGFGLFFIALSRAPASAGFWPLAAARVSSLTVLVTAVAASRPTLRAAPAALGLAALSGVLDMTANALFLLAVHHGVLVLVAVLVSLYPAATVLLAFTILRERLRAQQLAGVALALAAVGLIASG